MKSLNALSLDKNPVLRLPESFWSLMELTYLDLSGTMITSISPSIANMKLLEFLDLSQLGFDKNEQELVKLYTKAIDDINIEF